MIGRGAGQPSWQGATATAARVSCVSCVSAAKEKSRRERRGERRKKAPSGMPVSKRSIGATGVTAHARGAGRPGLPGRPGRPGRPDVWGLELAGAEGPVAVQGWQTPIRSQTQTPSGSLLSTFFHAPSRISPYLGPPLPCPILAAGRSFLLAFIAWPFGGMVIDLNNLRTLLVLSVPFSPVQSSQPTSQNPKPKTTSHHQQHPLPHPDPNRQPAQSPALDFELRPRQSPIRSPSL